MASWEALIGGLVQGQIEAWENWPEGYATPNRRIMYAGLNWCQEHHTEIIDTLRTLLGAYPMVMPASIDVMQDDTLRPRFESWWKTASIEAVDRHKLYKLAWDLVGSEFAGRHMLYEKFYAGNSLIVRNQSDREAPWQRFHDTVDGLLNGISLPGGSAKRVRDSRPGSAAGVPHRGWATAPCTGQPPAAQSSHNGAPTKALAPAQGRMIVIRKLVPVAVAVVAAFAVTASAPAQDAVKITLADQNSPQGWGPVHALQPWVKQVEEAGKGRIKMEVFPSQTLIKGIDMWRGVRTGIADIGWCVQGYWPEQTPLSDVMSLPFLPIKSAEQGASVLWRLYEKFPQIQKEYGDIQPLVLYTTSPNFLITSKKQVKTLDDMKGLKIRTLGGPPIEMAKALGASPSVMPMPDLYQALDKGVFDGAAVPWEAIHAFRLYEVAKNVHDRAVLCLVLLALRQPAENPKPAEGRARHAAEQERPRRLQVLGQELLRHRGEGCRGARQGCGHHAQSLRPAGGRGGALEEDRRRAAVGAVGQEDGRQGPQGGQADSRRNA